jgi:hypothetical protein
LQQRLFCFDVQNNFRCKKVNSDKNGEKLKSKQTIVFMFWPN